MPYYPPHPEPEPNGPEKKRGKKQEKEPFRSHALRTGAVCLLASLALYGGIRLISYITDLAASRKTKYEMMSVMHETESSRDTAREPAAAESSENRRMKLKLREITVPASEVIVANGSDDESEQPDLLPAVEYENNEFQHLGSVATNKGYSDWATTAIPADVKTMWYRFSRREDDYCIECSRDGVNFSQMRICHMYAAAEEIQFGIYACSPEESSFTAVFSDMKITECAWKAHDGQQPDEDMFCENEH